MLSHSAHKMFLVLLLLSGSRLFAADEDAARLEREAKVAVERGTRWLMSQQSPDDGGWHSQTYGSLKDGAAVTTLALYALAKLPAEVKTPLRPALDRGLLFLEKGRKLRSGAIASPDGSFDYPTYATAMWLTIRRDLRIKPTAEDEAALNWLLAAQLTQSRGFQPDHLAYGGWDLLGAEDAMGITTGSNVSVTFFALESLQSSNEQPAIAARNKARIWLERCLAQGTGGGFAFTPETAEHQHKAGITDGKPPRSIAYGTTTADGWRALTLLDEMAAEEDPRTAPLSWMEKHSAVDTVPGFEDLSPEIGWQRGLRFYYAQTLSAVISQLPEPARGERRQALLLSLLKSQEKDGSWKNDSARMREDDPLIATPLVLLALNRLITEGR